MAGHSAFKNIDKTSSFYLFTTDGLTDISRKYPFEHSKQKKHRGFVLGYATLVKRYEYNFMKKKCTNPHCLHHHTVDIDLHSFLYNMNRRVPLCDAHSL